MNVGPACPLISSIIAEESSFWARSPPAAPVTKIRPCFSRQDISENRPSPKAEDVSASPSAVRRMTSENTRAACRP